MKNVILFTAGFSAVLVGLSYLPAIGQQRPALVPPGRFQILPLDYGSLLRDPGTAPDKVIFRLDTETGTTWKYVELYDPDQKVFVGNWHQIHETR